jgi:hypothetical protein
MVLRILRIANIVVVSIHMFKWLTYWHSAFVSTEPEVQQTGGSNFYFLLLKTLAEWLYHVADDIYVYLTGDAVFRLIHPSHIGTTTATVLRAARYQSPISHNTLPEWVLVEPWSHRTGLHSPEHSSLRVNLTSVKSRHHSAVAIRREMVVEMRLCSQYRYSNS